MSGVVARSGARSRELSRAFAAVRGVAGLTLASRGVGFLRDVLMAMALGAGAVADAFLLAWTLPNLARRLFGEGAFAGALVPVFVDAREKGDAEGARRLIGVATTRLALGLIALTLLLEAGLAALRTGAGLELLAARGLDAAGSDLVLRLSQVLLPHLLLACLAGVLGSALNALDRFALPAAAPVLLNLAWIGLLLAGVAAGGGDLFLAELLAWGLLAAGVLQVWLHLEGTARAGLRLTPALSGADPERLLRVRRMFGGLVLGLALFQVNCLIDQLLAWLFVPAGGLSALYYANRLIQLPVGVLGVAVSTVVFPQLARLAQRGDHAGAGELVDRGVALAAFVSLPCAVGLACLAEPLVGALFARGAFDAEAVARTARVTLLLTPAIVASCVSPVLTRALWAEEESRLPVRISAVTVACNVALNLALVGPLDEAGLALATSLSQLLGLALLLVVGRRRRAARGVAPSLRRNAAAIVRIALLSLLGGAVALAAWHLVPGPAVLRAGLAVGLSASIYLVAARAVGASELQLLVSRNR